MATASAQSGRGNVLGRLMEYFTLRDAESELARMPEVARAEVADLIELARQQTAAAEALFAVGHTVEALRLGTHALDTTQLAADRYARALGLTSAPAISSPPAEPAASPAAEPEASESASAAGEPGEAAKDTATAEGASDAPEPAVGAPLVLAPWKRLTQHAGISEHRIQHTERTLAELKKIVVPRLEKDVAPAHVDAFRELIRARATIEDALAPATLTRGSLLGTRIWRGVTAGLMTLAAVFVAYYMLRPVEGVFVRASATWADSPDFRPESIIDGNDASMWLSPLHEGWIEVRIAPAVDIHRVTLVNAGSPAILDRGTRDYRLEIYAHGRLEQSIDGTFTEALGGSATHEVSVSGVERIRFVARTGYRVGSGLSEMRWE